ncbi:PTS sugar transporter subunit IIA [Levilactobacillus tujiorum]|uniref:PTS sugar transporter subunit IIA n=1 Tax=Levilactobacillus tujiorum TaxID=2912243 RepID=UPI00145636AB|nr:PTS sugar transporter subunit IIA [Levilactobacillus tujiorum]NLR31940.1 PTS sugar transporter subunit IIA [Levilactobacillus tujiorum]
MIETLLTQETVQVMPAGDMDWQTAIRAAATPLLHAGKIEQSYITAMINVVEENGPFINIGSHIALAHARPENGVNQMGMALMKVSPEINLVNSDHPITLFFVLAASDNTKHLQALQELAAKLQDATSLARLEKATTVDELVKEFKGAN